MRSVITLLSAVFFIAILPMPGDALTPEEAFDAAVAYREAVRINPEDASAWNNLGGALYDLKRYNDAIDAYRHALWINPEFAEAWFNLGVAYAFVGNRTAAINAVQELRRLDPAMADKLFNWLVPH